MRRKLLPLVALAVGLVSVAFAPSEGSLVVGILIAAVMALIGGWQ